MNDASLYNKGNSLQLYDAKEVLDCFIDRIEWKNGDDIMDIGCGDGSVLFEVILKKITKSCINVVAIDKSSNMVNFSRKSNSNLNVTFERMDIDEIPKSHHINKYDHIFSFNCLHWARDIRIAMKNIYDMLKDDGDFVFSMVPKTPIFDVWITMAEDQKWKKYCYDIQEYINIFHHMKDPLAFMKDLLYSVGFQQIDIYMLDKSFKHDSYEELCDFLMAINPFYTRIPVYLKEEYKNEHINHLKNMEFIKADKKKFTINIYYTSMFAYVSKIKN